jgi:hypothetical protein
MALRRTPWFQVSRRPSAASRSLAIGSFTLKHHGSAGPPKWPRCKPAGLVSSRLCIAASACSTSAPVGSSKICPRRRGRNTPLLPALSLRASSDRQGCETIQTAASERRLLEPGKDRISASCSIVSLPARARFRGLEGDSQRDRHCGATEGLGRRSGNRMRQRSIWKNRRRGTDPRPFRPFPTSVDRAVLLPLFASSPHPRPSRTGSHFTGSNRSRPGPGSAPESRTTLIGWISAGRSERGSGGIPVLGLRSRSNGRAMGLDIAHQPSVLKTVSLRDS